MEQIKAMLEAMEKDTAFKDEMKALDKAGNIPDILAAAAKKGFVFTEADLKEFINFQKTQFANLKGKELSPEELDGVAGGGPTQNRYDPNVCPGSISRRAMCISGFMGMWCDHYREVKDYKSEYQIFPTIFCWCAMGCFYDEIDHY